MNEDLERLFKSSEPITNQCRCVVKNIFRNETRCEYYKYTKHRRGYDLHHVGKSFNEVFTEFLALKSLIPHEITFVNFKDKPIAILDPALRQEWLEYHKNNSTVIMMKVKHHKTLHENNRR